MSYDLAVFEKKNAPADTAEFLKWYQKQTEWSRDLDYNEITHASPDLQQFFLELKDIFPPMNGRFSPSNEELSNVPGLEERLCDYCIGEDLIYLSFAYSMAEHAYSIVKRAACFHHVGFFDASGECIPTFFESPYPMLLEGEGFRPMRVSDFNSVKEKLEQMTVKNHSYLYLTNQTDSYIQVGGYGNTFTVEKRVYTGAMSYIHQKAEFPLLDRASKDGYVLIAGNRVKLKQNQILSKDIMTQLFLDFFQETQTVTTITWSDMNL